MVKRKTKKMNALFDQKTNKESMVKRKAPEEEMVFDDVLFSEL